MLFIHTHNKSMAFPVPIFIELINVQQHYIQIHCTKSRQNKCGRYRFMVLSEVWLPPSQFSWNTQHSLNVYEHHLFQFLSKPDKKCQKQVFIKPTIVQQLFVNNSCTKFHQNLTNSYFLTPYSLFCKERLKITCTQMLKVNLFIIFVGVTGKISFLVCQTHLMLFWNLFFDHINHFIQAVTSEMKDRFFCWKR